jgi:glycosyltransferase involved in cell wall biosynthesis
MSAKPLVSILLPTHNRAEVIGFSIQSIRAQSEANFELLVVGDGCTDATDAVVRQHARQDNRVFWLPFDKAYGSGYAHRNAVLKEARGRYIAFAAHDDIWLPDHLDLLLQELRSEPRPRLVYSRPIWIHPDGTLVPSVCNTDIPAIQEELLDDHTEIPSICVMISAEDLKTVGYWDSMVQQKKEERSPDCNLWKRILALDKSPSIRFISTPTTLHFSSRWRSDGAETHPESADLNAFYKLIKKEGWHESLSFSGKGSIHQQVWRASRNEEWIVQLRRQVVMLIDSRARIVTPLVDAYKSLKKEAKQTAEQTREELKKLQNEIASLKRQNKSLQAELSTITNAAVYKMVSGFIRKTSPASEGQSRP